MKTLLFFVVFYSFESFSKMPTPNLVEHPQCNYDGGSPIDANLNQSLNQITQTLSSQYQSSLSATLRCDGRYLYTYCGELKYGPNFTVLQDHIYDAYYLGDFEEGFFKDVNIKGCICYEAQCIQDSTSRNFLSQVQSVSQCNSLQYRDFLARKNKK